MVFKVHYQLIIFVRIIHMLFLLFIDPEFIDICFSIPKCLRIYNRLYWTWINKKYPMAGKIQSTRKQRTRFFYFSEIDAACSRGISQRLAHNWKSPF